MLRSQETPKHSVLVLGSTHAGKSALIQHIKKYADPGYVMDVSLLGNNIASKTETTRPFGVRSNLPVYEVKRLESGEVIDVNGLASSYQDEEDYRDVLLSNPNVVAIEEASSALSKHVDFQLFDTPGLNSTHGRDSEYATNIVKEVISTQFFNLIVFVISTKNPLTEEKQHALEYFAYVLRGLHSRIIFLYTHVDYSEIHHSNTTHHLNMTLRHKTLGAIFRRQAEKHIGEYPKLTIDLVTRRKPIIQCLIRNTIQKLLKMATKTPAILDTSAENIARIRSIQYPATFDTEQRKKFEGQLQTGSQQVPDSRQSVKEKPRHSILILGKTQSGKSRLVQHIKNYVDPTYEMDMSLVGGGNVSKTDVTRPFFVQSNFPVYEVYRKDSGDVIDLKDMSSKYNEDDYHDLLMSRDRDIGLRMADQDPNNLSDFVEFQFLDTPGLNDTNDRDSSHAVNIISEMINIRSFNLIIVIVPYGTPLTMEQRLALEYYANVLKGLHSRIVFLHTHVDYTAMHDTNTVHQYNLNHRKNEVKNLFRRHATDTTFSENDFEYPSLTIDLVNKKRPVIACLIRNTIREILVMATAPSAILDTGIQNIERVLGIAHPSKFSEDQRMTIKARFLAEEQKDEPPEVGDVNILVIGDFQSGKSTLIETFKLYADPAYIITTQHTAQDNIHTVDEEVKVTAFLADLYTIPILQLRRDDGGYDNIDLDKESTRRSKEDFVNLLNLSSKEAMAPFIPPSSSNKHRFNIYEGPGLKESAENFEKNIFNIHRTLVESEKKFHQVLFTFVPDPTNTIDNTIRIFSEIFSDLNSLFALVHTKVDYSTLHVDNKQFHFAMKKRLELLPPDVRSTATSYLIDCNPHSDKPVQRAKTHNIVRDILFAAAKQAPIALKSPLMKKTPKMVLFDSELKWQSLDRIQQIEKELSTTNSKLAQLQSRIQKLYTDYKKKDKVVNSTRTNENVTTRDDVEIVFEDRFVAEAEPEPLAKIYSRNMTCRMMPRPIEEVHVVCENVEIEIFHGGKGFNHCEVVYRRQTSAAALLEVKLYAKKLDHNGKPVGETKDMTILRHRRADLEKKLDVMQFRHKDLAQEQNDYNLLRYCIFRKTLPQAVVEGLVKAVIFESPIARVREVYIKSESAFGNDPYAADSEGVAGVEHSKKYTILMFGKTQAGKSTFIEFVKNYANQQYIIDDSLIGTGVKSKTARPAQFSVKTTLPSYEVLDRDGQVVDIGSLAHKCKDIEEYFDELSNRKVTLRLKPVTEIPNSQPSENVDITFLDTPGTEGTDGKDTIHEITFLDTPGIEDTDGKDTEYAPEVIHEMAKMRTFNLIVIIVNCMDHQSTSQQLSFDYYSKVIRVLQGHHKNVVFVYTHVDYAQSHHTNVHFNTNIKLRHKAYSRLFHGVGHKAEQEQSSHPEGQEQEDLQLFPMYTIDLNRSHRPIPSCMRLGTLREILMLAVENKPVPMNTVMKNLLLVYGISHPDELNVMQRARITKPMRAILEQRWESCEGPAAANAGDKAQDNTSNGPGDEVEVGGQSDCDPNNNDGYLPDAVVSDCSSSGDEEDSALVASQEKLRRCVLKDADREE